MYVRWISQVMSNAIERLGVIGDIHAEHTYLKEAIAVLEGRGLELLIATGDIADGPGSVDLCCQLLEDHHVVTVCGNHDRWLLAGTARKLPDATNPASVSKRSRQFLETLPRMVELNTASGLALLCHGLGTNDMAKVGADDFGYALESNDDLQNLLRNRYFRWVINGHSHRRMLRAFPGLSIINAGTLKRAHSPCFLEIDFVQKSISVFEFAGDGTVSHPPSVIALG
jgi:predicted phosphodiesterase